MARNKYLSAGMPDTTPEVEPPDNAAMEKAAAFFYDLPL